MKQKNCVLCVIFTILTLGLYGMYWYVTLTNVTNKLAPKNAGMGGVPALICSLVTGGIYGIYWVYKMGKKSGEIKGGGSDALLCLILMFFVGPIGAMCVGQGAVNQSSAG